MTEQVNHSLRRLSSDPVLAKLSGLLKDTNIFRVLRIEHTEIRHSNFIAWLLDPEESHRLGPLFLISFLRLAFSDRPKHWSKDLRVEDFGQRTVRVRREWNHIDILIESTDFIVAVENKVWAGEHSDQLSRYSRSVEAMSAGRMTGYIFLTLDSSEPTRPSDREIWNRVSHGQLVSLLERILDSASERLDDRCKVYCSDFMVSVRRTLGMDHEAEELARKLYETHREAIDFVIRSIPSRLAHVSRIAQQLVTDEGWVLGSCSNGFTRFLTSELANIIPHTGSAKEWERRETFLFELAYREGRITFVAAVAGLSGSDQAVLAEALRRIPGSDETQQYGFFVYFKKRHAFDVLDPLYSDEMIRQALKVSIDQIRESVIIVESAILGVRGQLSELRSP